MAEPRLASGYIPGLDGLRTLAIATVFLGHGFPNVIANAIGVDMFFPLSGFLITRGLLAHLASNGRIELGRFYLRRLLRLMPALLLMVVVLLAVAACFRTALPQVPFQAHLLAAATAVTYLTDLSVAADYANPGWLANTWTLAVEEQFYLIWPLVLIAAWRVGGARAALRCALVLAVASVALRVTMFNAGWPGGRIYNGFDTRAEGLLFGCALAIARPNRAALWAGRLWGGPMLAIGWIFLFVPWLWIETLSSTIVSVASVSLILGLWAQTSPGLAWVLEWQPIHYLGRISYGVYLWHWPIYSILWELGFPRFSPATAAIAGAASLTAAAASFHLLEQPLLRLKDRIGGPLPAGAMAR